jgi:hypothetical protein
MHGRRIVARLVVRRHALTQAFQIIALIFLLQHRHDTPPGAILASFCALSEVDKYQPWQKYQCRLARTAIMLRRLAVDFGGTE